MGWVLGVSFVVIKIVPTFCFDQVAYQFVFWNALDLPGAVIDEEQGTTRLEHRVVGILQLIIDTDSIKDHAAISCNDAEFIIDGIVTDNGIGAAITQAPGRIRWPNLTGCPVCSIPRFRWVLARVSVQTKRGFHRTRSGRLMLQMVQHWPTLALLCVEALHRTRWVWLTEPCQVWGDRRIDGLSRAWFDGYVA